MRSFLAVCILLAAACGGHLDTDPNPDGGSQCPSAATCSSEGATCTKQALECGNPTTETCTCTNGSWACPVFGCPKETCPINPQPGMSCFSNGMSCPSNIVPDCTDVSITCVCNGSQFECAAPDCPPPELCPPPDQVVAGQGCNVPGNELCTNKDGSGCFCAGAWQCEGADAGSFDAGGSD